MPEPNPEELTFEQKLQKLADNRKAFEEKFAAQYEENRKAIEELKAYNDRSRELLRFREGDSLGAEAQERREYVAALWEALPDKRSVVTQIEEIKTQVKQLQEEVAELKRENRELRERLG